MRMNNQENARSINIAKRQNKLIKSFHNAAVDISTPAKAAHYQSSYIAGALHTAKYGKKYGK